jgi:hypothetical protein
MLNYKCTYVVISQIDLSFCTLEKKGAYVKNLLHFQKYQCWASIKINVKIGQGFKPIFDLKPLGYHIE